MTDATDDDSRIDGLFTLPPEEFTAARNALVRKLRAEERRELATSVGRLRRPTAAAWAVNETVRTRRELVDRLLEAGADVRRAQRRALSGVRRTDMREATRQRRACIDEATAAAIDILDAHGVAADSHRADIAATFDAASADEEAAEVVLAARLSQALPVASGFASLDGFSVLHDTNEAPDDADTAREDTAREDQAARARREAIRALEDARRALAEAQATADRADAEVGRAQARAAAADQAARTAEDKARRLRGEADDLGTRAERARARATQARGDVDARAGDVADRERALQDLG